MLDQFALHHALADVCAPNPLVASCIGFEPSEEDVTHVAGQLCCSFTFASDVMWEVSLVSVISQLKCSREWAARQLRRHAWDPCTVLLSETNLNALQRAHEDDPTWELSELRTSLGTTVPVCSADDTDTIVTVQGLRVRVLDEDYMTVCWEKSVWPSAFSRTLKNARKNYGQSSVASSTAASSRNELW